MKINFLPPAREEFFDAIEYYYSRSPKIALKYIEEVNKTSEFLTRFPLAGHKSFYRTRKKTLLNFPYWIIYRVKEKSLEVVAIAHQARHPDYWKNRG